MRYGKLAAIVIVASGTAVSSLAAQWNTAESRARWAALSTAVYGAKAVHLGPAGALLAIESPEVAQDAALVPVTLKVAPELDVKAVDLIIDQNPSPIAAKIAYGPAADARRIKLRVRIDAFTNLHAIAHAADGRLLQTVAFVQGAGGCSAPMGMSVPTPPPTWARCA